MSVQAMLLIVISSLVVARASDKQVPARNDRALTPSSVARILVDQRAAVAVPAQGRVKLSIKKEARTFVMPGGRSTVVLLQLPGYQRPYVMRIASARRGIGRTTEMFVPSGVYLDADFQQRDEFGESQLTEKEDSLVAELVVDESHMDARYLVLYTRGNLVGQQVVLRGQDAVGGALTSALYRKGVFRVDRSLEAKLQVEAKERPGFAGVRTTTLPELVRSLVDQGAVVRVPPVGRVTHSIGPRAATFTIGGGPSSVALLRLPDYSGPYRLSIKSTAQGSRGIFIPSGVYFDAGFQALEEFGEDRLSGKDDVSADLAVGEQRKTARYLLLYTRGDRVGLSVRRTSGVGYWVGVVLGCIATNGNGIACGQAPGPVYWVERSLVAKLEIKTTPGSGLQ